MSPFCSTYYGFCGNAGSKTPSGEFRHTICSKWLHPVRLSQHPSFTGWVIFGEPPKILDTPLVNVQAFFRIAQNPPSACSASYSDRVMLAVIVISDGEILVVDTFLLL